MQDHRKHSADNLQFFLYLLKVRNYLEGLRVTDVEVSVDLY